MLYVYIRIPKEQETAYAENYITDVVLCSLSKMFVLYHFLFELMDSGPFIMTSHQTETIITNDCDRHILRESFCFQKNPSSLRPNHSETHSTSVYPLFFILVFIQNSFSFVLVRFTSFSTFLDNGFDGYRTDEVENIAKT